MQNKFYSLFPTFAKKWFWGRVLTEINMKTLARKGMRDFKDIVHVRIVEGTTLGDFLWNGYCLLIVSSKVLEIWKPFERFETYPVMVEGNVSTVEYTGVTFLGRGGTYDPVKSKAVYSKSRNDEGKPAIMKQEGLYFNDSQWDGSDLFTVDEFPCLPIVTERVVKAMKKAKITNCKYIPLERYGVYK